MANSMLRIGFDLRGHVELARLIRLIPAPIRDKVLRKSLGDVGREVVALAKAYAPKRTGALRNSLVWAVKLPKDRKRMPYCVVGPNRRYYSGGRVLKTRREGADRPAHYAHIVEFGTVRQAAQPFLQPAMNHKRKQVANIIATGFSAGIRREVTRLRKL